MMKQTYDIQNVGSHNRFFVRGENKVATCVHNCGYGMGVKRFRSEMQLEGLQDAVDMADMIISTYRGSNPNIKRLWTEGQKAIEYMTNGAKYTFGGPNNDLFEADGSREFYGQVIPSVKLPNGTYIFYQNIRKQKAAPNEYGFEYEYVYERPNKRGQLGTYRVYGGMLIENLIQSLAFGVLKWQALRIVDHGIPVKLNVHDEWISVVPASQLKDAALIHAKCMREVPDYIPEGLLDCEVDVGKNYADTTTVEGL